ncbi:MAG: hypothetical protein ACLP8S_30390, partial [Solirubrobacteraceae bacterium]
VRSRERLARTFEEILIDIDRWRPERGARVPICRREVEVARCEVQRLAERLRDPRPVGPRGVALAWQLLGDGSGPLYLASANDELHRRVRRARLALESDTATCVVAGVAVARGEERGGAAARCGPFSSGWGANDVQSDAVSLSRHRGG